MNSDERQLIDGLFDRMRSMQVGEKDNDAEALINQAVRQIPDSAYMLVQSVLVQEHVLQQAAQRIEALESRVRDLENGPRAAAAPAAGSGFLGGLFGGGGRQAASPAPAQRASQSVPSSGRPMGAPAAAAGNAVWGSAPGSNAGQQGAQAPAAGGGFMRSAMTTAAGVAGGMLAANAISSMLSGGSGATAATTDANQGAAETAAAEPAAADDSAFDDQGVQDASYDDGGWGGGDDVDLDI